MGARVPPIDFPKKNWVRARPLSEQVRPVAKRINVSYDFRPNKSNHNKHAEALEADELLEVDAQGIQANKELETKVDVHVYPSLHSMMHNAYATIDSEFRQLARISQSSGLDHYQGKHFNSMVNSYAKLMQLELQMREQNNLEAQSDEQIQKLAEAAYKKLTGKPMPKITKKTDEDG